MNEKTQTRLSIIGLLVCTALYAALIFGKIPVVSGYFTPTGIKIADTTFVPVAKQGLDTIIDVKGKNAFFIGDSHTANFDWGWQKIVCDKTKMRFQNFAVVGKHTPWMIQTTKQYLSTNYDYCFIYGGANDIHGNRNPFVVAKDIQKIVDLCNQKGVHPVVLTGFDAKECVRPIKGQEFYPEAYTKYQKILMDSIKNAIIIDTRVVSRSDCGDWTCHMNPSGHKKVANVVIHKMKFKTY